MNLYWSVYEALEEETLVLADNILFNNEQLGVYSVKLGNLIVRSAIEIEALSKELYCSLGGEPKIFDEEKNQERFPYFDMECLDLLVRKWKIDKKKIQIVSSKIYFNQDNSVLTPLRKCNKARDKGSQWNRAYQALKHNRTQSMEKATVINLLNALGALYILNLYYRNDVFWDNVPIEGKEEYRTHSKIFSPFIYEVPGTLPESDEILKSRTDTPFDECIYLKKYTDESAMKIREFVYSLDLDLWLQTISSDEFVEHGQKHVNEQDKINILELIKKLGLDFDKMFRNARVGKIPPEVYRSKEIVINKCQQIYLPYTYEDFLETPKAKNMQEDRIQELNRRLQSS